MIERAELLRQMEAAGPSVDRIAELCFISGKTRKACAAAGAFEALALCIDKYADVHQLDNSLPLQLRCVRAIEALSKRAEKEGVQQAGSVCFHTLTRSVKMVAEPTEEQRRTMAQPGLDAIKSLTKNNVDNTKKLARTGGYARWLDPKSTVRLPDSEYGDWLRNTA